MRGIEEGYELPPEADANLFEMTDAELAKRASTCCRSRSPRR